MGSNIGQTIPSSSTSVSITAAGYLIPSAGQTLKMAYNQGTGSSVTVGTVTAGKTGYLYAVVVWSASAGNGVVYQADGATALMNIGTNAGGCSVVHAGGVALCTYGSTVAIKASFPATHYYSVFWFEQ